MHIAILLQAYISCITQSNPLHTCMKKYINLFMVAIKWPPCNMVYVPECLSRVIAISSLWIWICLSQNSLNGLFSRINSPNYIIIYYCMTMFIYDAPLYFHDVYSAWPAIFLVWVMLRCSYIPFTFPAPVASLNLVSCIWTEKYSLLQCSYIQLPILTSMII